MHKFKIKKYGLIPCYILFVLLVVESLAHLNPLEALIAMLFNPFALLINLLIISLCFLLLLSLFNNKYLSSSILLTISIVLGIGTKIKYDFRGTGFSPADFLVFGEGAKMANALSTAFILKTLVLTLIFIVIAIFLIKKMTVPKLSKPQRLITLVIVILLFIPLFLFTPKCLIVKNDNEVRNRTAMEMGSYFYFLAQFNNKEAVKKPTANKEDLESEINKRFGAILENIDKNKEDGEKPDIIYIQSESFFDPTEELGVENFSEDPLPFYHSLKNESDSFKVTSPVYGGDTVNAEFEVLTGLSLTFFPQDMNIFVSYLRKPVISLGSILRADDYYSLGLHPYIPSFYSRNMAYDYLGFNQFDFLDTMEANDKDFVNRAYSSPQDIYASDIELSNQIKESLEKNPERNNFIFAISIQTHAPFNSSKDSKYNVTYTGDKSSQKSTLEEFNGYISNLKETDDSLRILLEYLKTREKETLVVFYGDHQPRLAMFPYADSLNMEEKQLRHEVPAFIWSNKETLQTKDPLIDMTALGEKGLSTAGVPMPNYFYLLKYLREVEKVDAFNSFYLLKDGQYYFKGQPEYEKIYKDYYLIFKDVLEGKKYLEKENNIWLVENNK